MKAEEASDAAQNLGFKILDVVIEEIKRLRADGRLEPDGGVSTRDQADSVLIGAILSLAVHGFEQTGVDYPAMIAGAMMLAIEARKS